MKPGRALAAAVLLLGGTLHAAGRTAQVTFRIEGMSCEPCASAIEMQLRETRGVKSYAVSFEDAEAKVDYDPALTTLDEIARAIGATGFRAYAIPTSLAGSLAPLAADFDGARGRPRFVAILSPACSLCLHGAAAVRDALLGDASAPELELFVVWAPMLAGDDEPASRTASKLVEHARVRQYWDPARRAGTAFRNDVFPDAVARMRASLPEGHTLKKPFETRDAAQAEWDIYMFFGPDAEWRGRAPAPARFLRQVVKNGPRSVLWRNDYSQAPFEADLAAALRQLAVQ